MRHMFGVGGWQEQSVGVGGYWGFFGEKGEFVGRHAHFLYTNASFENSRRKLLKICRLKCPARCAEQTPFQVFKRTVSGMSACFTTGPEAGRWQAPSLDHDWAAAPKKYMFGILMDPSPLGKQDVWCSEVKRIRCDKKDCKQLDNTLCW
eukprot:1404698-Rhodomonas_salina.1